MQIASVSGERRAAGNRHANQRLRRRGMVPAVIYGHGEPPEVVSVSLHDLLLTLERLQHVVKLQLDGRERQYLIKDVQYDHLQKSPVHVDLMRVDPNERVRVKVPVDLKGEPHGTHEGGVLVHVLTDLEVECRLLEIPEQVRVNVAHLGLAQALHVKDLELPEGVRALHAPEDIIAVVRPPRGAEAEAAPAIVDTEAPKEPEVFGRVAKEQEDEGGA